MRKIKYEQKVSIHFSVTRSSKDKIEQRAFDLAKETGWTTEKPKEGKGPNMSAVVDELIAIGFVVLDLFGEDWQDHLQVVSEPIWAKQTNQRLGEVMDYLKGMSTMTPTEQNKAIEEIKTGWDMEEGMLE